MLKGRGEKRRDKSNFRLKTIGSLKYNSSIEMVLTWDVMSTTNWSYDQV